MFTQTHWGTGGKGVCTALMMMVHMASHTHTHTLLGEVLPNYLQ